MIILNKRWGLIFLLAFLPFLPVLAQGGNPLRDSLARADEALKLHPDSIDLRLRKAGWNVELGQWEYAKAEYDIVLSRRPRNIAALYFRAYVNEKLGRYGFARQDYMSVLAIVPDNFEAKLGLALVDNKDNKRTKAMDEINQLVEAFPDSAIAYAARADMERERQMYLLAEYDYSAAIVRDPANKDYILNRTDVLLRLGRKREAQRDLELLVRLGTPRRALDEYFERLKR